MQERRGGVNLEYNERAVELVGLTCQSLGLNLFVVDREDQ